MRLGILTGGGDVPGLNVCIKAVVHRAAEVGYEVYGFRRGWAGPLNVDPDDDSDRERWVMPLAPADVRKIDRTGGTMLHTSRTNPKRVASGDVPAFLSAAAKTSEEEYVDCTEHVLKVMDHLAIDTLVPIGGDDTLSFAAHLSAQGFPVVAVPKTMDNDVNGTEYCIGFSTAISRSVEFIHALRSPAGSHERFAVIELFGRNSGETALVSGYLADADRVLLAEVPFDIEHLTKLLSEDRDNNPSRYAVVVVSEGARMIGAPPIESGPADAYGHRKLGGIGEATAEALKSMTGVGCITQRLAYLMRAGAPDALDRLVAASFGHLAVHQIENGVEAVMMAVRDGKYSTVPIDTCTKGKKRLDIATLYDAETYRPRITHLLDRPMYL